MAKHRTALDELASEYVGGSQKPNLYFVSVEGRIIVATTDESVASEHYFTLLGEDPCRNLELEDRSGSLASCHWIEGTNLNEGERPHWERTLWGTTKRRKR